MPILFSSDGKINFVRCRSGEFSFTIFFVNTRIIEYFGFDENNFQTQNLFF